MVTSNLTLTGTKALPVWDFRGAMSPLTTVSKPGIGTTARTQIAAALSAISSLVSAVLTTGGSSSDDWGVRSTASGVVLADRLQTSTKLISLPTQVDATHWLLLNGNQDHVTLDTSVKVPGAAGSWRWDVRASDGANNGDVGVYFGNLITFGAGSTVWFSYRIRVPATESYQAWQVSSGTPQAKRSILSYHAGSNQANEIVVTNSSNFGQFGGYCQDGSGAFNDIASNLISACSSTDIDWQPSVDNGANTLTGTNPDSGAAWTPCEQDRRRYGRLYSATGNASVRAGFGDPLCGGVRELPDEWMTVTGRVIIGNFGSANNKWALWIARDGQPYIKIFDASGILLGSQGPDYDTLWLLPYVTFRTGNSGTKVTTRTNNITGAEILVSGPSTPVGAGSLEYTASTGRFRWFGNGETFGVARGYSAANNILTLNVCSGGATNSYLVVRVTPGALPTSGVVTDTVTIAAGRPDTFVNYNDVIISTKAINAPGGFAPPGAGGTSALATLAASMAAGTWAELTTIGINSSLLSSGNEGGVGGNSIPYTNQMDWDPVHKKIKLTCSDHGAAYMPELTYDEATNTWTSVNAGTAPSGAWPFGTHAYGHFRVRPDTGDMYSRYNGGGTAPEPVYRRLSGGNWATYNNTGSTTYTQIGVGSAWWPGSSTGATALTGHGAAGCYILCEIALGVLMKYDPLADAWTYILVNQTIPTTDVYHTVAAYSKPLNCMVYGGGNSSLNADTKTWLWRLDQDGTSHRLTNSPIGVGIQHGNLAADPVTGKFLIWGEGRNFYQLDPAGTGTYTLLTGSRQPPAVGLHGVSDPSAGAGGPDAMVSCALPDHGVVAYISASGGSYANIFLYKHA